MNWVINYVFEASIFLGIAYLLYWWNKRSTTFSIQRLWLLGTVIISGFVPFLSWQIAPESTIYTMQLPALDLRAGFENSTQVTGSWTYWDIIKFVYVLGILFMSVRFLSGLIPIIRFVREGIHKEKGGIWFIYHNEISLPFSFGPFLFWNPNWEFSEQEEEMIVAHETVHIRQKHTIDILLLQAIKIIAWFHPLVYLFENEIKNIHEYQADQEVLNKCERKRYIGLLFQNLLNTKIQLSHSIFQTPIQKRIKMIKKKKEDSIHPPTIIVSVVIIMSSIFYLGCGDRIMNEEKTATKLESESYSMDTSTDVLIGEVYPMVPEMPRFPGCEDVKGWAEREFCSEKKLMNWLYKRIEYPKEAKEKQLEGTVVVKFIVSNKGQILDPTIVKDIGSGTGKEVLRVINEMKEMDKRWIPGKRDRKPVHVEMKLPVRFVLE